MPPSAPRRSSLPSNCNGGPALRWDPRDLRYHFRHRPGDGSESFSFQVTVKGSCGSRTECERIARLCIGEFAKGATRDQVIAFRDGLYLQASKGNVVKSKEDVRQAAAAKRLRDMKPRRPRRDGKEVRQIAAAKGKALKQKKGLREVKVAPKGAKRKKPEPEEEAGKGAKRKRPEAATETKQIAKPARRPYRRMKTTSADPDVDLEFANQMREWEEAEQRAFSMGLCMTSSASAATLCTVIETCPLRVVPSAPAAKALIDGLQLNSDVVLPVVGFGTYKLRRGECLKPVLKALEVGYRLIDTAQIYDNEGDVGQALRQSGIPRDRVCLETKHWRSNHGYERTLTACRGSLQKLGVDYIDLYLIHWPGCKTGWPLPSGACSPPDWTPAMRDEGTWRAMEQLYQEGKVKALGVSNYSIRHLKSLLKMCRVRPSVNQVEFHPWLVQSELLEFCKREGIVLQAYASLGSGDVSSRADFFALKPVREAAKRHDKTSAQVLLRWAMEKGITVLPKSKSADRMVENFGVFDFKLSAAEVAAIDKCHRGHRFAWRKLDPDSVP